MNSYESYTRSILKYPLLSEAEEVALAKNISAGDTKSREKFIKSNLRLVVKIAMDYNNRSLPLSDLISEGNIGLIKAVDRFDPSHGVRFCTYAVCWIKMYIRRAMISQSRVIQIPVHVVDIKTNIAKKSEELKELLGREPVLEEIGMECGLSLGRVDQYLQELPQTISLDEVVNHDGRPISETVAGGSKSAVEELMLRDEAARAMDIIAQTDQRAAKIVAYKFGLEDGVERTSKEIAKMFGVSGTRVDQILKWALGEIRKKIESTPVAA